MSDKPPIIAIIPNLFTAGTIFSGFVSMVYSYNYNFKAASMFVLLGVVFDSLDGRISRMAGVASDFGIQFDSLADIVAFGVAPALLFYFYCGIDYGRLGIILGAMYVIFGAIRLARFNLISKDNISVSIGLPITISAMFFVFWILLFISSDTLGEYKFLILLKLFVLSLLMVSNIRYPSFKKIKLKKPHILKLLVSIILLFAMIYLFPLEIILILVSGYVLYGPLRAVYNYIRIKIRKNRKPKY